MVAALAIPTSLCPISRHSVRMRKRGSSPAAKPRVSTRPGTPKSGKSNKHLPVVQTSTDRVREVRGVRRTAHALGKPGTERFFYNGLVGVALRLESWVKKAVADRSSISNSRAPCVHRTDKTSIARSTSWWGKPSGDLVKSMAGHKLSWQSRQGCLRTTSRVSNAVSSDLHCSWPIASAARCRSSSRCLSRQGRAASSQRRRR